MAAPFNDNFANATWCYPSGSYLTGSNISASAEVGETSSFGRTVWYTWTNVSSDALWNFRTTYNSARGETKQPLESVIQVFSGSTLANIKELTLGATGSAYITADTYYPSDTFKHHYGGWEMGSSVVFKARQNETYYIRVDGFSGSQGNYILTWNMYNKPFVGSCGGCPPELGYGITCIGTAVTPLYSASYAPIITNFSNVASHSYGKYYVRYCRGAIQDVGAAGPPSSYYWVSNCPSAPSGADSWNGVQYFTSSISASVVISGSAVNLLCDNNIPYGFYGYANVTEAEISNQCLATWFTHTGGSPISLWSYGTNPTADLYRGDQADGNPSTTWGLYRVAPQLTLTSVCAGWITPKVNGSLVATINNHAPYDWNIMDKLTASLDLSGGVTACTPQYGFNLLQLQDNSITIPYSCTSNTFSTNLRIQSPSIGDDIVLPIYVSPVVTTPYVQSLVANESCAGATYRAYAVNFAIPNYGSMTEYGNMTITVNSGILVAQSSGGTPNCYAFTNSRTFATSSLECNGAIDTSVNYPNSTGFWCTRPTVTTNAVITSSFTCADGASYGPYYTPITIPA